MISNDFTPNPMVFYNDADPSDLAALLQLE
jgi:hypothetical protein